MFDLDKAAKAMGLHSYDTALPQDWADDFHAATGAWPNGMIVWSYDGAGVFGRPVAVSDEGARLLAVYEEKRASR